MKTFVPFLLVLLTLLVLAQTAPNHGLKKGSSRQTLAGTRSSATAPRSSPLFQEIMRTLVSRRLVGRTSTYGKTPILNFVRKVLSSRDDGVDSCVDACEGSDDYYSCVAECYYNYYYDELPEIELPEFTKKGL
ncbi:unnamed protein product [Cyprideis torosa]|uniref:Uncharacterized protein n=1 Tax=Cyprideis torosa TaxID=163714 RepID=A0A7R8ZM30_9CRUS|nr:unnamed protein product [Cyprideis torosa]CAG0893227.1 unnamed protein product [Cyprideis torosa]